MADGSIAWVPELPEWLTAREVAALFQVNLNTPGKWASKGQLPAHKTPGGQLRFHRDDVIPFLRESRRLL